MQELRYQVWCAETEPLGAPRQNLFLGCFEIMLVVGLDCDLKSPPANISAQIDMETKVKVTGRLEF
jgi:hypothetical protein